jgi:uncharacterized protein (TIRG00374 family)
LIKPGWKGLIGLALTVVLLWWAFHGVNWSDVRDALGRANPWLVAGAVVVSTCVFPLRALRWRPILDPVAPGVPYGALWRATAIGMMANNVLPGRAGEFVRAYALTRETSVKFSLAFGSIVVDRVFDSIIVLLLMVVATLAPGFPAHTEIAGRSVSSIAWAGVVIVAGISIVMYAIVYFPDRLIALYDWIAHRIARRFEDRGHRMLRSFADGLSVLRDPLRFVIVFAWALLHWLVQPLAFYMMFRALGIDVPFSAALFLQGLIVFAVAAPSTPGYAGLFEAGAIAGLAVYGVSKTMALTWALSFHILSLVPITVIGLYYLARTGLRLGELRTLKQ